MVPRLSGLMQMTKEIKFGSIIACISVGAERPVEIFEAKKKIWHFPAKAGSLYTMEDNFQSFLKHCIPQASTREARFSITFRLLVPKKRGQKRKQSTQKKANHFSRKKAGLDLANGPGSST